MSKKTIFTIIIIIIIAIIIFYIFFNKNTAKILNFGNNMSSQEMVDNLLNMTSYEATIEVEIKSNKNVNKYIIKQKYNSPNYIEQEVLEPTNIAGIKIKNDNGKLTIENTKLNLTNIYENYEILTGNRLDLITFVENYKANNKAEYKENSEEIIMKSDLQTLYIDKKTGKPTKLEETNNNKKMAVYILYKEVKVNSK